MPMDTNFTFGSVMRSTIMLWIRTLRRTLLVLLMMTVAMVGPIALFAVSHRELKNAHASGHPLVLPAVGIAASVLLQWIVQVFFIGVMMKGVVMMDERGENWTLGTAFKGARVRFVSLCLVTVMCTACFWLGLVCFIVPGLVFAVNFYVAPVHVFETESLDFMECLRESRALTAQRRVGVAAQIVFFALPQFLFLIVAHIAVFAGYAHPLVLIGLWFVINVLDTMTVASKVACNTMLKRIQIIEEEF